MRRHTHRPPRIGSRSGRFLGADFDRRLLSLRQVHSSRLRPAGRLTCRVQGASRGRGAAIRVSVIACCRLRARARFTLHACSVAVSRLQCSYSKNNYVCIITSNVARLLKYSCRVVRRLYALHAFPSPSTKKLTLPLAFSDDAITTRGCSHAMTSARQ